jgi:hypothetical protein
MCSKLAVLAPAESGFLWPFHKFTACASALCFVIDAKTAEGTKISLELFLITHFQHTCESHERERFHCHRSESTWRQFAERTKLFIALSANENRKQISNRIFNHILSCIFLNFRTPKLNCDGDDVGYVVIYLWKWNPFTMCSGFNKMSNDAEISKRI